MSYRILRSVLPRCLVLACLLDALVVVGWADEVRPVHFNRDVLPILAEHCFACHGFDNAKREAGLRLDQREGVIGKLESGATPIVPGDLARSEVWLRITSTDLAQRMPPPAAERDLSEAQRGILKAWIEQGAVYEPHWAYLPPRAVEPPDVAGVSDPIDRFILARLQAEGIAASPMADRTTFLRRVSLDLTGLPPTPLEVDAFLQDQRPDAFERVVDRLLASEHFGERWARWWLDLAHYGDSDGYLQDFLRPVAWRYRQWVCEAFNQDQSFAEFTIDQLAGDLRPNATVRQRMGTGFLRNTLSNREGGADLEEYRVQQVIDRAITVGTTWLGLTTGCAQCHDHKYDPVSQREFYQLYAFFNQADEANLDAPLPGERLPHEAAKGEYDRKRAELLQPVAGPLAELQADWERRLLYAESHPNEDFAWDRTLELLGLQWGQNLGEGQLEGLNIIKTPLERRRADQRDRLLDYFLQAPPAVYGDRFKELKLPELRDKLVALAKELPPVTRAPAMEVTPFSRPTHVHLRGDFRRPGDVVSPGTPACLPPLESDGSPDRLDLAKWLVSPQHPLMARVTVNRFWQELFGRGLVATSENFGVRGAPPSHPELLDWLALEFQRGGWSVKSLLRKIVLTKTYRQDSAVRPDLQQRDPLNRWLARQTRLRLSGETVRDSALAVSGLLNRTIGGPSVKPPQPASVSQEGYHNTWEVSPGADRYRRGLYTFLQRTSPFAQFVTFDLPDTSRSCTRRERSNTPLQALHLLNDPAFLEMASALARRVAREAAQGDDPRIERAYLLVLGRPPATGEAERLRRYLAEQRRIFAAEPGAGRELVQDSEVEDPAWVAAASVLLNLDEFITRE